RQSAPHPIAPCSQSNGSPLPALSQCSVMPFTSIVIAAPRWSTIMETFRREKQSVQRTLYNGDLNTKSLVPARHSTLDIPHSTFDIRHSSLGTRHSTI